MTILHSYGRLIKEPPRKGRFFCYSKLLPLFRQKPESSYLLQRDSGFCRNDGNVLFYVFLAIGLMASLTYAFVKDSRENYSAQSSVRITEELFSQANMIRSAVQQCAIEFPQGGGDIAPLATPDGVITNADNANNPYPIDPDTDLITNAPAGCVATGGAPGCVTLAADNNVKNLTCIGAPIGEANMFQGANNQGRFLPPPSTGFTEWTYTNDANGVYIQTTAASDLASVNALSRLMAKFDTCQADLDYGSCGARCFTVWILRKACP